MSKKEYLVTIEVSVCYQLPLLAENITDLESYPKKKDRLPIATQNVLTALEKTTGLNDYLAPIVDRHVNVLEVVDVEKELVK